MGPPPLNPEAVAAKQAEDVAAWKAFAKSIVEAELAALDAPGVEGAEYQLRGNTVKPSSIAHRSSNILAAHP